MKREYIDVVVIGGGPAGMMAAGRAAEMGARVMLVEKNPELGKKLLLTGGGRCNLTNREQDNRKFIGKLGSNGAFFFSPLAQFGIDRVIEFFERRGMRTKTEDRGRVFPASNDAGDVLRVLEGYMREGRVKIVTDVAAAGFNTNNGRITQLIVKGGEIEAKAYVLCTGGRSRPETGSTGEGLKWLESVGHTVHRGFPALVPLKIADAWVKEVQGLSMPAIRLTVWHNGKKETEHTGDVIFTHFGMSGPAVLDVSKRVGELLKEKGADVRLVLDLKPGLTSEQLDERIRHIFGKNMNKALRNALDELLPRKLVPIVIRLSGISGERPVNGIGKEERLRLVGLLKGVAVRPIGLLGFDRAIASSGGVDLGEIDSKTMRSKVVDNLYVAGDVLDIDAPSGGYNLQLCWSAGRVAGEYAAVQALAERDPGQMAHRDAMK